jgi:hypothetical protein
MSENLLEIKQLLVQSQFLLKQANNASLRALEMVKGLVYGQRQQGTRTNEQRNYEERPRGSLSAYSGS